MKNKKPTLEQMQMRNEMIVVNALSHLVQAQADIALKMFDKLDTLEKLLLDMKQEVKWEK